MSLVPISRNVISWQLLGVSVNRRRTDVLERFLVRLELVLQRFLDVQHPLLDELKLFVLSLDWEQCWAKSVAR